MADTTTRRSTPRQHQPNSVDLEKVCENIAEIAVAVGEHGRRAYDAMALHPDAAHVSPGDLVREAIVEAGRALAQLEMLEPALWERHNWRDTSLAFAEAICSGTRRFDAEGFLR